MREKTQEAIELERSLVMAEMRLRYGNDVREIPSYFKENADNNAIRCLGQSIKLMADADIVYFCSGWEKARGCRIEHEVACAYDLEIMYAFG